MPEFQYESTLSMLRRKRPRNEADVNADMIDAVLKNVLNYEPQRIAREHRGGGERPDFVCYNEDGRVDLIVEGKDLCVDLDKRPSRSDPSTRIPKIQLDQYLRKHPDSGHGVFGILSNGNEWRVCRRIENDIEWLSEKKADTEQELRDALEPLIKREALKPDTRYSLKDGIEWLDKIIEFPSPNALLEQINPTEESVFQHNDYVVSVQVATEPRSGSLFDGINYLTTMTSMGDDGIISISDIRELLKEAQFASEDDILAGIATAKVKEGNSSRCKACRIFVWEDGKLHTSSEFDPQLPGTRAVSQLNDLASWRAGKPFRLMESLSAKSVQEAFYDDLAGWFSRTGTSLNDLRHLIRVLFAWFLKEHGYIPHELFEKHRNINVHDQLEQLFTKTLSVHPAERPPPPPPLLSCEILEF